MQSLYYKNQKTQRLKFNKRLLSKGTSCCGRLRAVKDRRSWIKKWRPSLLDIFRLGYFKALNLSSCFSGCTSISVAIPDALSLPTPLKDCRGLQSTVPSKLAGPHSDEVPQPIKITLVRSRSVISVAIQLSMILWCLVRFKKPVRSFSHCEVRFGELCSGAVPNHVETRSWPLYLHELNKPATRSYSLFPTNERWASGKVYLDSVENVPYEFANIWWHLVKIVTGVWKGSNSAKEIYCFEHALRFLHASGYKVSSFHLNPLEFQEWADKNL